MTFEPLTKQHIMSLWCNSTVSNLLVYREKDVLSALRGHKLGETLVGEFVCSVCKKLSSAGRYLPTEDRNAPYAFCQDCWDDKWFPFAKDSQSPMLSDDNLQGSKDLRTDVQSVGCSELDEHILIKSILDWWKEHEYDTVSNGEDEYNVFDEEPEFVKLALSFSQPSEVKKE